MTWLRVTLSVPVTPTAVVMPAFISELSWASGHRDAGPASPPPPVIWTCMSTKPGTMMQLLASRTSDAIVLAAVACSQGNDCKSFNPKGRPYTCLALVFGIVDILDVGDV